MKKRFSTSLSKGFTLVELLVVIAIIGVLSTLLLLQLNVARAKSRDSKRIADVNQLRTAVEQYYDDNANVYPIAISDALVGKYFTSGKAPLDPTTAAAYGYSWDPLASPTKYVVSAELEQKSTALNTDADVNATAYGGGSKLNGATEACTAAANDCVYDLGF